MYLKKNILRIKSKKLNVLKIVVTGRGIEIFNTYIRYSMFFFNYRGRKGGQIVKKH